LAAVIARPVATAAPPSGSRREVPWTRRVGRCDQAWGILTCPYHGPRDAGMREAVPANSVPGKPSRLPPGVCPGHLHIWVWFYPFIMLRGCARRSPYTQALVTLAGVGSVAMVEVLELPVHPTLVLWRKSSLNALGSLVYSASKWLGVAGLAVIASLGGMPRAGCGIWREYETGWVPMLRGLGH
jgi:hypothetical protein